MEAETTQETEPKGNGAQEPETNPFEERLKALEAQVTQERKAREDVETKYKDVSSKLTRTQQESAEMTRFLKANLPEINKKKFNEEWEESPEKAVRNTAVEELAPIKTELEQVKWRAIKAEAEAHLSRIVASKPQWMKYEQRVRELGNEYPDFTTSHEGIQRLFKIAISDDPETERRAEVARDTQKAETEKERAVMESSSAKTQPRKTRTLSSDELRVAGMLKMKPEDYAAQKDRLEAGKGR